MSKYTFLRKKISGIFTIPSGIITTDVKVLEKIANEIPQIGVLTTKSIGLESRVGNREPILSQYAPGCFINAVGLTNPGAEEFVKQLKIIKIPSERFLLISIFGKDAEEFVKTAKILAPLADGLELNFSCPHAQGYGMVIGQNPDLVKEITLAVKKAVSVQIILKLTPNVPDISLIAKAGAAAGADGFCAINTVGPGYYSADGNPVLTNKLGGLSGKGILPLGLKCVKEIKEAVDLPLIACGGISGADDVRAYQQLGAGIFGVGSALTGLSTAELKEYFVLLERDLENNTNEAVRKLKIVDMNFQKCRLVENKKLAEDLSLLIFDASISIQPGQFIFVWLPGFGEKPFSVLDNAPLTLAVQKRGRLTEKLVNLKSSEKIYFRGPYGLPLKKNNAKHILVAGGCGLAALEQIGRDFGNAEFFIGAKDKTHLFHIKEAQKIGPVYLATEDGSAGERGLITDLLEKKLRESPEKNLVFYNCGPEKMIEAAIKIEEKYALPENIWSSADCIIKCGVGLCGSCADKRGNRSCVDGVFINE